MVLLTLQNVTKAFGLNVILNDVSLTLKEGQRLGLVGVNGSGKTTLMKIIAGDMQHDSGDLSLVRDEVVVEDVRGAVVEAARVREDVEFLFVTVAPVLDSAHRVNVSVEFALQVDARGPQAAALRPPRPCVPTASLQTRNTRRKAPPGAQ